MPAPVTTELIWREVEKRFFAVLSYVTPRGHARSAVIIYAVRNRLVYIATGRESWKAKHIAANPYVALNVSIPKRVPLVPWAKIPDAAISFHGTARILTPDQTDPTILSQLTKGMVDDPEIRRGSVMLEVRPTGDFVTYGVGVPLLDMRDPKKAQGRARV